MAVRRHDPVQLPEIRPNKTWLKCLRFPYFRP
jgi:hypothetical protein